MHQSCLSTLIKMVIRITGQDAGALLRKTSLAQIALACARLTFGSGAIAAARRRANAQYAAARQRKLARGGRQFPLLRRIGIQDESAARAVTPVLHAACRYVLALG